MKAVYTNIAIAVPFVALEPKIVSEENSVLLFKAAAAIGIKILEFDTRQKRVQHMYLFDHSRGKLIRNRNVAVTKMLDHHPINRHMWNPETSKQNA